MTLQEVIDLGYTTVFAKINDSLITFKIDPEYKMLHNETFYTDKEDTLDYIIEDSKVMLYQPNLYVR